MEINNYLYEQSQLPDDFQDKRKIFEIQRSHKQAIEEFKQMFTNASTNQTQDEAEEVFCLKNLNLCLVAMTIIT